MGTKRQTKGVLKICRLEQSLKDAGFKLKAEDDLNLALALEWHIRAFFTQYKMNKLSFAEEKDSPRSFCFSSVPNYFSTGVCDASVHFLFEYHT